MIRRVFALLGGGAALLTFASCATFETDNAATVNGTDISADAVDAVRAQIAANPDEFTGGQGFDSFGDAGGDLTRAVVAALVSNEVASDILDQAGAPLTAEQVTAARDELGNAPDGAATDMVARLNASGRAIDELPTLDAVLQARYETLPASTGVVCLDIVSVPDEAAAMAATVSMRGGSVPVPADGTQVDSLCLTLDQALGALSADEQDFVLDGQPGDVLAPLAPREGDTTGTWTVLRIQPWADAEGGFPEVFTRTGADGTAPPSRGQMLMIGALATADVTVSSAYGRWDGLTGEIVALTPAAEPAADAA